MNYNAALTPIKPTSKRYPGLHFVPGDLTLRKKDPGYKDRIIADDSQFDIFDVPNVDIQSDKVKLYEVIPFAEYSKSCASWDIESVGDDGGPCKFDGTDVIVAIGLKINGKHYIACNKGKTEKQLIQWFYAKLESVKVTLLYGYNIYGYDLGMLLDRSTANDLKCPWSKKDGKGIYPETYRWSNAVVNGKSLVMQGWDCRKYELIDLYPQTVLYDGLVRKLDNYRLKDAVIGFGLRNDRRIEIGADVYKYWADNDTETISEYLKFDLDDTEFLWNFLIPQRYFMKAYMPWTLTRITTTGTGSWWNKYLLGVTKTEPDKGATASYQGALTYYHAGLFKNAVKLDFAGLYPSIMLSYLCCSDKDINMVSLKTLKFLLEYRIKMKAYANETGDKDADGQQMTAKVLANSLYGLWNTQGLNFNDPYAGAAITAYGRNLARFMIKFAIDRDCECHAIDTDGAIFTSNQEFKTDEDRKRFFTNLTNEMNAWLPGVTSVDYEDDIELIYVPVTDDKKLKKANQILADKIEFIEWVSPDTLSAGLSKNYLMFTLDRKTFKKTGERKFKLTAKGKFKKRDKSWLEAGMFIEWFTKRFYEGETVAKDYLDSIRAEIATGNFDVTKFQKTVLVASSWKKYPEWGFPIGTKPTVHYVWRGELSGVRVIKKEFVPSADVNEPYSVDYYLARFDELTKGIPGYKIDS
jgi:DNA polymerase, archaea type